MSSRTSGILAASACDLLVLTAFAVAQPLFNLLSRNAGFLVAHQARSVDVVLLTLILCAALPLSVLLLEMVASWIGWKFQQMVHFTFIGALTAAVILPLLRRVGIGGAWTGLGLALLLGLALSLLYRRLRSRRFSLSFLLPTVGIFPALFLFHSPVHELLTRDGRTISPDRITATADLVLVVFDEFPLTSLLDENGEVDPDLYPNFAQLSRSAAWYRNATTVSEGTLSAVPAILDGMLPSSKSLPQSKDHPHTLFRLLGGSYDFHVVENNTMLCPADLCGDSGAPFAPRMRGLLYDVGVLYLYLLLPTDLAKGLPDISHSWKNFASGARQTQTPASWNEFDELTDWTDRPKVFRDFINSVLPTSKPKLHFIHTLLPHAPWEYLPSGKKYTLDMSVRGTFGVNDRGLDPQDWTDDPGAVIQAYQRHLLQVGFVDRLLGELLEHLKKVGLYDSSLIMITADHGTSFRPKLSRRKVSSSSFADIMAVPLFVKSPHQNKGVVDDSNVQIIDILPTLADILKIDLPWKTDGHSVLSPSRAEGSAKLLITEKDERLWFEGVKEKKYETVKERINLFGSTRASLFMIGPRPEIMGSGVAKLAGAEEHRINYDLENPAFLNNVDFTGPLVLTHLTGRILRTQPAPFRPLALAFAVNGTISALTETYRLANEERFSAICSDSAFQSGHNKVDAFLISKAHEPPALRMIRRSNFVEYRWGELIPFTAENNNTRNYQAEGWAPPEKDHTWTNGKRAKIVLPVSAIDSPVTLQARLSVFLVPGKLDHQTVRILVNQHQLGERSIKTVEPQEISFRIPPEYLAASGEAVILFEMPGAVSPASLGIGSDVRELGAAVAWLKLTREPSGRSENSR